MWFFDLGGYEKKLVWMDGFYRSDEGKNWG